MFLNSPHLYNKGWGPTNKSAHIYIGKLTELERVRNSFALKPCLISEGGEACLNKSLYSSHFRFLQVAISKRSQPPFYYYTARLQASHALFI